jgi:hypothetical protein
MEQIRDVYSTSDKKKIERQRSIRRPVRVQYKLMLTKSEGLESIYGIR